MKFHNVFIQELALHRPPRFISSEEIESRLGAVYTRLKLPPGRLELQTGIKSRGAWPLGTKPSDLSAAAGLQVLERFEQSGGHRDQIGVLIHAAVCRDFLEPATASFVHEQLKLSAHCQVFDLSNACLGVMNSLLVAAAMIESGQVIWALVVSGENGGPLLEKTIEHLLSDQNLNRQSIKKYIANLTIGSGAVALLLGHRSVVRENAHQILGATVLAQTSASQLCVGGGNTEGLMMETDSEALLHAGLECAEANWQSFVQEFGAEFEHTVTHQVGIAHKRLLYEKLKLDQDLDYSSFPEWGNTGSVALPLTLIEAALTRKFKQNDRVAMLGIGSGLHSVMMGIKW